MEGERDKESEADRVWERDRERERNSVFAVAAKVWPLCPERDYPGNLLKSFITSHI